MTGDSRMRFTTGILYLPAKWNLFPKDIYLSYFLFTTYGQRFLLEHHISKFYCLCCHETFEVSDQDKKSFIWLDFVGVLTNLMSTPCITGRD